MSTKTNTDFHLYVMTRFKARSRRGTNPEPKLMVVDRLRSVKGIPPSLGQVKQVQNRGENLINNNLILETAAKHTFVYKRSRQTKGRKQCLMIKFIIQMHLVQTALSLL